jgi:hypothetical protein
MIYNHDDQVYLVIFDFTVVQPKETQPQLKNAVLTSEQHMVLQQVLLALQI